MPQASDNSMSVENEENIFFRYPTRLNKTGVLFLPN
jgi:hypothetical protein